MIKPVPKRQRELKGLQSKKQAKKLLGQGYYFHVFPANHSKGMRTVLKRFDPALARSGAGFFLEQAERARRQIRTHDALSKEIPTTKRISTHVNLKGEIIHRMERVNPFKTKKELMNAIPRIVELCVKADKKGLPLDAAVRNWGLDEKGNVRLLDSLDGGGLHGLRAIIGLLEMSSRIPGMSFIDDDKKNALIHRELERQKRIDFEKRFSRPSKRE